MTFLTFHSIEDFSNAFDAPSGNRRVLDQGHAVTLYEGEIQPHNFSWLCGTVVRFRKWSAITVRRSNVLLAAELLADFTRSAKRPHVRLSLCSLLLQSLLPIRSLELRTPNRPARPLLLIRTIGTILAAFSYPNSPSRHQALRHSSKSRQRTV